MGRIGCSITHHYPLYTGRIGYSITHHYPLYTGRICYSITHHYPLYTGRIGYSITHHYPLYTGRIGYSITHHYPLYTGRIGYSIVPHYPFYPAKLCVNRYYRACLVYFIILTRGLSHIDDEIIFCGELMLVTQELDVDLGSGFAGGGQTVRYLRKVTDVLQLEMQWIEVQPRFVTCSYFRYAK